MILIARIASGFLERRWPIDECAVCKWLLASRHLIECGTSVGNLTFMTEARDPGSTFIVVPCFNESFRLNPDYWENLLHATDVNLVFVDDGSTDSTFQVLQGIANHHRVSLLRLERNFGKAEAVRFGMLSVIGKVTKGVDVLGFLDADGSFDPQDVARMLNISRAKFSRGYEALWSSRVALSGRDVHRSRNRHYVGRVIATGLGRSFPNLPYDSQSGFKLFVFDSVLIEVLGVPFRTRWLFDVEIFDRWREISGKSLRVWEEPVNVWHDVPGSNIRGREVGRILTEVFSLWHTALVRNRKL